MRRTVVVMPGDGIGKVVLPEALRVLHAVGFEGDYVHADIGWDCWVREGNPLPQRTLELLRKHKLGLFGAVTSKPKREAEAELNPTLRGKGLTYTSPIVGMRQAFNLDVCVRPCRSFPGNPLNFVRKQPGGTGEVAPERSGQGATRPDSRAAAGGGFEEPYIDAVIFRQNTEGLYAGVEWLNPPADVRSALATHAKFRAFLNVPGPDLAVGCRVVTRPAAYRIAHAAFEYAHKHGYKHVTVCEKPNVLRDTSGMMEDEARRAQQDYPDIGLRFTNVDAQMMWLTKDPENYGVIVASNLFGDIISDAFAGLVGGLGFACSANLGNDIAIFEPTHGSAPKYAALDPSIVNPIAMILSAAMLLDHVGEAERAAAVRDAVAAVVKDGTVRTYDMMRLTGSAAVISAGAATTTEMTDVILQHLHVPAGV